jgi:hypothetical protein
MMILIQKMRFWAASYLIGWLIGAITLAYTGLLTIFDTLIYLISLFYLGYRLRSFNLDKLGEDYFDYENDDYIP